MSEVTKKRFRKKKGSEVAGSNQEDTMNESQMEVMDLGDIDSGLSQQEEFEFAYAFNEYLRMMLVKILPPKLKSIRVYSREKVMLAPPQDGKAMLKNVKNEFTRYSVKIIKFNTDADIDQIEFHMPDNFQIKVFRAKFVELTLKNLEKLYGFKNQVAKFISRLNSEEIILVRILKKYEQQGIKEIQKIITSSNSSNPKPAPKKPQPEPKRSRAVSRVSQNSVSQSSVTLSDSGDSSSLSSQEDDAPSFYQIQKGEQKKERSEVGKRKSQNLLPHLDEPDYDQSASMVAPRKKKTNRYHKKEEEPSFYSLQKEQKQIQEPRREAKRQRQREHKIEEKMHVVKVYYFNKELFDANAFKLWLNTLKKVKWEEVTIQETTDPYDDDAELYKVTLRVSEKVSRAGEDEKREALEVYFNFRKVVPLIMKNERYKQELIDEYTRQDNELKIKFVKGYRSSKYDGPRLWKCIHQRLHSDTKRGANTLYFELFYIEGLKTLVLHFEQEIKDKVSNEPLSDIEEEIMYESAQLADHIRTNHKLKQLVRDHAELSLKEGFSEVCTFKDLEFILTGIKITLLVKCDRYKNFDKTKQKIINKIQQGLMMQEYQSEYKLDNSLFDKLSRQLVIVQRGERSFTFVARSVAVGQAFNFIHSVYSSLKEVKEYEKVVSKEISKRVVNFVEELMKDDEYNQIKYTIVNEKDQTRLKFYGRLLVSEKIGSQIDDFVQQMQEKYVTYHQLVKQQYGQVLRGDPIAERIQKKYGITLSTNLTHLDCKIVITPTDDPKFKPKTISIIKTRDLNFAPIQAIIAFRSVKEVEMFNGYFLPTFKNFIKNHKDRKFNETTRHYGLMMKDNTTAKALMSQALQFWKDRKDLVMVMPAHKRQEAVRQVVACLVEQKILLDREINVTLVEVNQKINTEKQLGYEAYARGKKAPPKEQKIVRYYVQDNKNHFYYSNSGNKKIEMAVSQGVNKVILDNEDLKITHHSHTFVLNRRAIVHLQSTKEFPLVIKNDRVEIVLDGRSYELPPSQKQLIMDGIKNSTAEVPLSVGVYQINLSDMEQVNLFSGYKRNLHKEETVIKTDSNQDKLQVYYQQKVCQLTYSYSRDDQNSIQNLKTAVDDVEQLINSCLKHKELSIKDIKQFSRSDYEQFKETVEDDGKTETEYLPNRQIIVIKTLEDRSIARAEKFLALLEQNRQNGSKLSVSYPVFWDKQTSDIETFEVQPNTSQFNQVQNVFTVATIKTLIRIQNTIIYKKFYEQGNFLEELTGRPIKKMKLFHGTKTTEPSTIYKDKEQAFNINYSSDNNLLGRGIYFAEKSEYSHSYCYNEADKKFGLFSFGSSSIRSMFMCEVLVGDSQKCPGHNSNIKDTSFRDQANKIRYQSMTDYLSGSHIYVVYKSRRAYPLYLIKY